MQYTIILKPCTKTRRKITAVKKHLEALYGYTGSLSNKGVHITMAYLRNSQFLDVPSVKTVCESTKPFTFELGSTGYFEKIRNNKKSYVVFYRVITSPEMDEFHKRLVKALGDNSSDTGKFIPHITLIRKNVHEGNIKEILNLTENSKISCEFLCKYLILGKRSSQNSRWHFEHLDFRKT